MSTVQIIRSGSSPVLQATRPSVSLGTPALAAHNTLSGRSTADAHPTSAITGLDAALAAKQPLDADLTAIAGLTSAADTVPYFTGPGAAAVASLTAAGRSLIAGASASAQLTTLGIASLATSGIAGTLTLSKSGTTARTATFPDAAITVAGSSSALTATRVPFATTGGLLADSGLYWDNTSKYLGINVSSPTGELEVDGTASHPPMLKVVGVNGLADYVEIAMVTNEGGLRTYGGYFLITPTTNDFIWVSRSANVDSQRFRIERSTGRVGIGAHTDVGVVNGVNFGAASLHIKASPATSGYAVIDSDSGAGFILNDSGQSANNRVWTVLNTGTELIFRAWTDGVGTVSTPIKCQRSGNVVFGAAISCSSITTAGGTLLTTSASLTNGAAAATGTLTNAPAAGNPTKWIPINDNGTTRYIPAW